MGIVDSAPLVHCTVHTVLDSIFRTFVGHFEQRLEGAHLRL